MDITEAEVVPPDEVLEQGAAAPDSDDDDVFSDDEEEEEAKEAEEGLGIPVSHQAVLSHADAEAFTVSDINARPVTALTVDPAGARAVTGLCVCLCRMWDFNGMDSRMKHFRELEPGEGYPVNDLAYSNTGDRILIITGSAQAQVVDREGTLLVECSRGVDYLYDLARTHGHVAQLNSGCWHPRNGKLFMTASNDGTIRVWNCDDGRKSVMVGKCRGERGKRLAVQSCAFNTDGKLIAAGCSDGTIHLFNCTEKVLRPKSSFRAHAPDTEVTCVRFARDGRRLLSRGRDHTLKLWDVYSTSKPKAEAKDLPCFFAMTDCMFSPDEKHVITGTSKSSSDAEEQSALIVVLDAQTLERKRQIGVPGRGVIRVNWHLKLNQIFATCADGTVKIFYDPAKSFRGALLCAKKAPRRPDPLDMQFGDVKATILNPSALPLFREDQRKEQLTAKKRAQQARKDPKASKLPKPPAEEGRGVGRHGQLLGHATSISQYIARRTAYDRTRDEDPREAILKYADEAEKNPYFVAPAYEKTQPDAVYDLNAAADEDADDDDLPKKKVKTYDANVRRA